MDAEYIPLCPRFERGMRMLGKPWTGLIVERLLSGPKRFGEIEADLPISARLLSERLKELEKEKVVRRDVFPETPVRIEYSLTAKGAALERVVKEIRQWAVEWADPDSMEKPGEKTK